MAAAISRRSALAAIALGVGGTLAACDSSGSPGESTAAPGPRRPRESMAPPSPVSAPDSGVLLLTLTRAQHLAATSRAVTGADGGLRTTHRQVQSALDEQVRVLEELLRAGNVPVPSLSPPTGGSEADPATPGPHDGATASGAAPTGPDADSATSSPTGRGDAADQATSTGDVADRTTSPAERARAQLAALGRSCLDDVTPEALRVVSEVSAPNLPVLIAVCGQRGATAALLAEAPAWDELAGPRDGAAAGLLAAYQPAVYGFEVLAARSRGDERDAYERVLAPLRRTTRQIVTLAGEAAAPAPLGYGMPDGTDTQAGRDRVAGELLATLAPTLMVPTQVYVGDTDSVAGTVRLLAEVVRLSRPWVPMVGFPGLQVPGA